MKNAMKLFAACGAGVVMGGALVAALPRWRSESTIPPKEMSARPFNLACAIGPFSAPCEVGAWETELSRAQTQEFRRLERDVLRRVQAVMGPRPRLEPRRIKPPGTAPMSRTVPAFNAPLHVMEFTSLDCDACRVFRAEYLKLDESVRARVLLERIPIARGVDTDPTDRQWPALALCLARISADEVEAWADTVAARGFASVGAGSNPSGRHGASTHTAFKPPTTGSIVDSVPGLTTARRADLEVCLRSQEILSAVEANVAASQAVLTFPGFGLLIDGVVHDIHNGSLAAALEERAATKAP